MGIQYELSAVELLKRLGYEEPSGREELENFMQEKGVRLPKVYREFMELAMDCPMLETSDLWTGRLPYFFYEEIEEGIEDQKADWEKNPEEYNEGGYHLFYQFPKERWEEKSCDYLEIGSDYGAGIVTFGIRKQDLEDEDPPVYMYHEAHAITDWKKMYERLSDFLLEVVLSALIGIDYLTAEEVLEENGWVCQGYNEYLDELFDESQDTWKEEMDEESILSEEEWQEQWLSRLEIDLTKVQRQSCNWGGYLFCCRDEEKDCFYVGRIDEEEGETTLITIVREEE